MPARLRLEPSARPLHRSIVGISTAMATARSLVEQFAPVDLPVLLVGETGTGKDLLAREIHRVSGRRGPLVDVNCGALPRGLAEAELFGHVRGAFTGALRDRKGLVAEAAGGTLFLDELCSLDREVQVTLLRVLETKDVRRVGETVPRFVDVRMVAAVQRLTGSDPGVGLRPDLYQRLAGAVILLPPLRDRMDDLMPLADHFLRAAGRRLDDGAEAVLAAYTWPGNVRELERVLTRAAVLSDAFRLSARVLEQAIALGPVLRPVRAAGRVSGSSEERARLLALCRQCRGNANAIAAAMGVSRATVYRRLKAQGISLKRVVRSQLSREFSRQCETN